VHTACDAITALKSDSAGKEAEQEAGAESAEDALIAHAAEEVLVAAQSAALAAETASVLHSEVGSFDCEVLPVIPILETPEAPSEIETERTKPSEEDPNMKEFVHRVVDDVLEHPSPEGSLQETASQDRSEVQTDRTDRSLAIAGPESICSAGSEEAALLQAAVGADLSEGIDLAETAPSGVVSARTAASLEERIVAEVAGDLLPEQNQAALLVLVKELQRRPLQNPEVELHLLSAPATFAAHGAEPSAADTVPADETPVEAEDLALETAPGPGPPPRFTALKAESDGGAQPTSVPGKPAVPDFIYANASTKAEALASDVAKEIDTEDLLAIASEALALDVIAQEIHLEASPSSPNTPSLGGTVSELSVEQSGFDIPEDMSEKVVCEAAAAIQEELKCTEMVAKALAQDVMSKEIVEEVDPVAIASQALALDVLSKEVEVEEEVDPLSIAAEALALDAVSQELEVEAEPEEEPEGPAKEEDIVSPFLQPKKPRHVRPPAGSGAAAAVAHRLAQHTIEGLMKLHEQENRELEAIVKEKFYTPAPGTKLPTVLSLPSLPMDPRKANDETKRILRLNYHRVVGQPNAYHQHRPKSAMDMDLGEDLKLHHDPELQEKRFLRQRVTYQAVPGNYLNNCKANVSPARAGISKKIKPLAVSQSSPHLPPATGAERRPPKLRPLAKGADNLRKLADGALPSRILRP